MRLGVVRAFDEFGAIRLGGMETSREDVDILTSGNGLFQRLLGREIRINVCHFKSSCVIVNLM